MSRLLERLARLTVVVALSGFVAAQEHEGEPNAWFPKSFIDLGTHLEGEIAKGRWDFKNPNATEQKFRSFQPSCTCSKATVHIGDVRYTIENQPKQNTIYRIEDVDGAEHREIVEAVPIEGGQEGYIEFQVDLRGVNGSKEASVVIQTDDEANRMINLRAKAAASQFFVVIPPEINLNKMSWQDTRQFTARITSPIQPDFEIVGVDEPVPDQMKVEYRKETQDGVTTWIVDGTYGPNVDPRAGGGIVTFGTNVQGRKVQLRVMAWVEGPLTVRPGGFVPFGLIRKGEGASKVVEFEPNGDFDLQIEKVVLKNLTIDENLISIETRKEGKVCKLEIKVSADAPRRLVRGDIEVYLNHPAARLQELQFNGFVR